MWFDSFLSFGIGGFQAYNGLNWVPGETAISNGSGDAGWVCYTKGIIFLTVNENLNFILQ